MATIVKTNTAFIERDCIIEHDGHKFESGGSYLLKRQDNGKYQGILYANPKTNEVTSWDGKSRIPAYFGKVFNSNFYNCKRQYCWFTYEGHKFIGINYSVDWQECITVKELVS